MTFHWSSRLARREFFGCMAAGAAAVLFGGTPSAAWAQAIAAAPNVAGMKIAMIGAGREGGALGTLYAKHGHPIMFASRHPEQLKDLVASAGTLTKAGTVEEAIAFADVVFLVLPYAALEQIGKEQGKALSGKPLVVDVSNPIARRDGEELVNQVNDQGGAGLMTQKYLPGAHIVRAFNALGAGTLAELSEKKGEIGVPIAGDDPNAIGLASALIREVGSEPVLGGGLALGKCLVPGAPLSGALSPAELKQAATGLK